MTNKQAIEELKQIKQNHIDLNYRFRHLYDDYIIAVDKAIASLEAWDKVLEEIDNGHCKVTNDYDHGRNYGLYMASQIIEKYKKEIEE